MLRRMRQQRSVAPMACNANWVCSAERSPQGFASLHPGTAECARTYEVVTSDTQVTGELQIVKKATTQIGRAARRKERRKLSFSLTEARIKELGDWRARRSPRVRSLIKLAQPVPGPRTHTVLAGRTRRQSAMAARGWAARAARARVRVRACLFDAGLGHESFFWRSAGRERLAPARPRLDNAGKTPRAVAARRAHAKPRAP
jgi:hypothetical protein